MKLVIALIMGIAATSLHGAFEPIDEIMQDGRQIRAASKGLGLKLVQDNGGSSDYGEWFYTIRRSYRIADPSYKLEESLLTNIRDRFSADIEGRGWQVRMGQAPSREANTDLLKWIVKYSAGLPPLPHVEGKVILRSFRVDGGYMVLIDVIEQRKPNKTQQAKPR